jgi:hypothetical protein
MSNILVLGLHKMKQCLSHIGLTASKGDEQLPKCRAENITQLCPEGMLEMTFVVPSKKSINALVF